MKDAGFNFKWCDFFVLALLALLAMSCASTAPATTEQTAEASQPPARTEQPAQPEPQPSVQPAQPAQPPAPVASLSETKSVTFVANGGTFANAAQGERWLDDISAQAKNVLSENPNARFEVVGYVADITNRIDDAALSQRRAEFVADGLVRRGIPREKISVASGGRTRRWGNALIDNRVVTVRSVQ